MKSIPLLSFVAALCLVGCATTGHNSEMAAGSQTLNPSVVAKLKEIVDLRELQLEHAYRRRQAGMGAPPIEVELALAEARVELAREQHEHGKVIDELQRIVDIREKLVAGAELDKTSGRSSPAELTEIRVQFLQAQVELERCRER